MKKNVKKNDNLPIYELNAMIDDMLMHPFWDKMKVTPQRLILSIEAKSELLRTKRKIIRMIGD